MINGSSGRIFGVDLRYAGNVHWGRTFSSEAAARERQLMTVPKEPTWARMPQGLEAENENDENGFNIVEVFSATD